MGRRIKVSTAYKMTNRHIPNYADAKCLSKCKLLVHMRHVDSVCVTLVAWVTYRRLRTTENPVSLRARRGCLEIPPLPQDFLVSEPLRSDLYGVSILVFYYSSRMLECFPVGPLQQDNRISWTQCFFRNCNKFLSVWIGLQTRTLQNRVFTYTTVTKQRIDRLISTKQQGTKAYWKVKITLPALPAQTVHRHTDLSLGHLAPPVFTPGNDTSDVRWVLARLMSCFWYSCLRLLLCMGYLMTLLSCTSCEQCAESKDVVAYFLSVTVTSDGSEKFTSSHDTNFKSQESDIMSYIY